MRERQVLLVVCTALTVLAAWANVASAVVVIEDFSNAAVASYTTYEGNKAPVGSAIQAGWDIGGRYFKFEDVNGDRLMTSTGAFGSTSVAVSMAKSGNVYVPTWTAAQASEAISLAGADELQFGFVNRMPKAGYPNTLLQMTMYYWDASANATATAVLFNTNGGNWAVNEAKTIPVSVASIAGFDKVADTVYGFQFSAGGWNRMSSVASSDGPMAWSFVTYTPEPTTLALLALSGLFLRRRSQ